MGENPTSNGPEAAHTARFIRSYARESGAPPLPDAILETELREVCTRRLKHSATCDHDCDGGHTPRQMRLVGMAISGGGIRSATFNLGILQRLNYYGLLPIFDYLSTVSGGGYIGSWWSAWLSRTPRPTELFPRELSRAQLQREYDCTSGRHLDTYIPKANELERLSRPEAVCVDASTVDPAANTLRDRDPIDHLRLYSNYLSPHTGMFSSDTWRMVALYSRNLILNLFVLLPVLMVFLLAGDIVALLSDPNYLKRPARIPASSTVTQEVTEVQHVAPPAAGQPVPLTDLPVTTDGSATRTVETKVERAGTDLLAAPDPDAQSLESAWAARGRPIRATLEVLGAVWAVLTLAYLFTVVFGSEETLLASFGTAWVPRALNIVTRIQAWILMLAAAASALLLVSGFGHTLVYAIADWAKGYSLLALVPGLASAIFAAVKSSPSASESGRQATPGRLSSLVILVAPYLFIVTLAVVMAWGVWEGLGFLRGTHGWWLEIVPVALLVAVAGTLAIDAVRTGSAARRCAGQSGTRVWRSFWMRAAAGAGVLLLLAIGFLAYFFRDAWAPYSAVWPAVYAMACCVGLAAWLGWLVDPNALGVLQFYRARLIRAYLGASNKSRPRNSGNISDVEDDDDILLTSLANCSVGGPYHLVNTTLNLVGSRELGIEQRKADNFILSKQWCGSHETGYRDTATYAGGGLKLGTALAASGAAFSPNMGVKSSAMGIPSSVPLAMLLTLFNIRLGYWIANPALGMWHRPSTILWPWYVLREFFSQTTNLSSFVYLTDGGHFDNLGIYSLIERQCKYIVAIDAGADAEQSYEDLSFLVHVVRIDFGVNIDIDLEQLRRQGRDERSLWHCAVGRIRYPKAGGGPDRKPKPIAPSEAPKNDPHNPEEDEYEGTLIYLKPSITGDEAQDILGYGRSHREFPHQTTLDQFFDEAQFESYRALGDHVASIVFRAARDRAANQPAYGERTPIAADVVANRDAIFSELQRRWEPSPRGHQDSYFRISEAYSTVEKSVGELATSPDALELYFQQIFGKAVDPNAITADRQRLLHLCTLQAQFMEEAFVAFDLDQYWDAARNRGWMQRLKAISQTSAFEKTWPDIRSMYSPGFQRFVVDVLPYWTETRKKR